MTPESPAAPPARGGPTQPGAIEHAWQSWTADAVAEHWETSQRDGLPLENIGPRRQRFGPNALQVDPKGRWQRILVRQFKDVLIAILLVAAVAAFAIGEAGDAVTILAIVVLNGALGFAQEWKAEQALAALHRMLTPRCKVLRAGEELEIDARDLVPGDLVLLEIGDRIPADLRLTEAVNLRVDESSLTGESLPVQKQSDPVAPETPLAEQRSVAWMGTAVVNGWGRGIAVATGMHTQFGRIASLSGEVEQERTPLQRHLATLGIQLGVLSIAAATAVGVAGWWLGKPLVEMFMTGVSLAVAVVPEGLPAVVTITLAIGIRAMVRRKTLLRRLPAAEALGAATVICTDKTGTLTQNEMTVRRIWLAAGGVETTGVGYDPAGHFEAEGVRVEPGERPDLRALLETGLACNHARVTKSGGTWQQMGAPTEAALVVAAYKAWLDPERVGPALTEFSFNSSRKRMTIVRAHEKERVAHVKGAPEVLVDLCGEIQDGDRTRPITADDRARVLEACEDLARGGLRTLALARRALPDDLVLTESSVETDLVLLGVVGIIDPPRAEVPDAVRAARTAGIRVVIITGDAAATALAVANRIGLASKRAIEGTELVDLGDQELLDAIDEDALFARTTPEHKLRIVTLLQGRGDVVGMTGDGVNDAPALKRADIGIAMGIRGTDVAKGAADIVLTDDSFSSIVGAIEEGRRQYDNIRKFVRYLLSSNTGEVMAILANVLLGGPLILLPVQILWMNLVTDGMTAVALGLEPPEEDVMQRPPRGAREPILDRSGVAIVLALGAYLAGATLWLFHAYLGSGRAEDLAVAQTVAFTGIIVFEKANVFNFRSLATPLRRVGWRSNPWVLWAWIGTVGLQVCAVYVPFLQQMLHTVPLGIEDWGLIALFALPVVVVPELWKEMRSRSRA